MSLHRIEWEIKAVRREMEGKRDRKNVRMPPLGN